MNTLDLRKKIEPQVKIVERVIFQKQPWYLEVVKVFSAIIIVSTIVWGISKADDIILPVEKPESSSFSVIGTVTSVATSTITLDIQGTNEVNTNTFTTDTLTTIQTSKYAPLTISDIDEGDKVIIQGTDFQGDVKATRLISFASVSAPTTATTTSTSTINTEDVDASTSATSTEDSTTTSSIIDSLTNTVQGAVQSVVDVITGSSTATSTSNDATTTDTSSSTPSIIDSLTNTVQGAVQSVVNVITGGASSSTPDDASSTPN